MVNAAKLLAGEVATSGVTINTVTAGRIESYQIDRSRYADEATLATAMAQRPRWVVTADPPRSPRPCCFPRRSAGVLQHRQHRR
jgi:NAD(P)-dependent dehydrogenase (short-subunit alcohol dehydrogenase family)